MEDGGACANAIKAAVCIYGLVEIKRGTECDVSFCWYKWCVPMCTLGLDASMRDQVDCRGTDMLVAAKLYGRMTVFAC
jgi:hypothetical protein